MSAVALRPAATRSPLWIVVWAVPIAALLSVLPWVMDPYRTIQLAYGLIFAIAGLGFNILLGYTGLLSFGHSAYFGVGAYAVAFMVKYLHVQSMELFLVGTIVASLLVTALFGYVCVRYTRIFFSILTLALSQVLWSLAFKFFWVTGGTDGLRVPTPKLLGVATAEHEDKSKRSGTRGWGGSGSRADIIVRPDLSGKIDGTLPASTGSGDTVRVSGVWVCP